MCRQCERRTFGRYNNVDVTYGFPLKMAGGKKRRFDLVVATDRGCDRLRIYRIDPSRPHAPLVEITDPQAPRVFPAEPLDDQSTAYGIALQRDDELVSFVTLRVTRDLDRRNRGIVIAENGGT